MNNPVAPSIYQPEALQTKTDLIKKQIEDTAGKSANLQFITFRAVFGHGQGSLTLFPAKDGLTGKMKGVKPVSEHTKINQVRAIDANTSRKITDGLKMFVNDEIDSVDLEWVLLCDEIALSLHEAQMSPKALYYIEDIERDLNEKVKMYTEKYEASRLVFDASGTERREVVRLLGHTTVMNWTDNQVLEFLNERIQTNPIGAKDIKDKFNSSSRKTYLFFHKLSDSGVISRNAGMFWYGEIPLGSTEQQAVAYLQDERNMDIIEELYRVSQPQQRAFQQGDNLLNRIQSRYESASPGQFTGATGAAPMGGIVNTSGKRVNPFVEVDKAAQNHFASQNPGAQTTTVVNTDIEYNYETNGADEDADMPDLPENPYTNGGSMGSGPAKIPAGAPVVTQADVEAEAKQTENTPPTEDGSSANRTNRNKPKN